MNALIDTHQHLWDPTRFRSSWMDSLPSIRHRSLIEEYRAATAGYDIAATVYVDTDVDAQDLAAEVTMIFCLADDPANRIAGIVAGAKMETADPLRHLALFFGHPKFKGVRRVLHTQPDALFSDLRFVTNVGQLADRRLSFDLCVAERQLPAALELVQRCPGVSFILDHCGGPNIRARQPESWRQGLRALAAQPNVTCKISGIVASADPDRWVINDLRPYIEHTIETFGWKRIMWGSDWPVCKLSSSLARWIDALRAVLDESGASPSQQPALFHDNARRIYGLDGISN